MKKKLIYVLVSLFLVITCTAALAAPVEGEEEPTEEASITAPAEGGTYLIGPGDVLEISVWKDEALTRQIVVPPDSVISFPLVGDIDVTDMTVTKLREALTEKLTEYMPDATVTVLFAQINSMKAYVIGKVNKPGEFPISMETNVMQVLAMAGGMNPYASSGKILILRRQDNQTEKIPFNYKEVEKGENLEQNILLKRGDVVVVP